jgi:hypothetical protein
VQSILSISLLSLKRPLPPSSLHHQISPMVLLRPYLKSLASLRPHSKLFHPKQWRKAQRLSGLPKDSPVRPKYKLLKGVAKEEASTLIDQTLTTLLQLSQKHGTDPTAATKLFQKKLDYFSSSLWDMWEMHHAVERAVKDWENKEDSEEEEEEEETRQSDGNDEVSGSDGEDGDGIQSMSIIQITFTDCNLQ